MSVSSITDLSRQHMMSILGVNNTANAQTSTSTSQAGSGSTFAQMLSDLQQLEKADPKQYSKVAHQISKDLSNAATNIQGQGNTTLASQLASLSQQFAAASSGSATQGTSNPLQMIGSVVGKVLGL